MIPDEVRDCQVGIRKAQKVIAMTDNNATNEQEYMRIEEAAGLFKVSRATLYTWIKRFNIRIYAQGVDPRIKYVKPAEIRKAREEMSQFKPVQRDEGE